MSKQVAKIVIVGGGVIGCSVAFHLAAAGHEDIVLLDRGPLANGTTPYAAGQTAHLTSHKSALPFALYCTAFFEQFADKTGYAIDFRQSGSLRIAMTEQYLPRLDGYVAAAAEVGDPRVRLISVAEAQALAPLLTFPEKPAGILYNGGDGYISNPKTVALGYAAGARDRGVRIQTHTQVTGIDIIDERIRRVKTTDGTIDAEWVVVAAGAWTRQLTQQIGLNIASVPVRHQAYVTAPMASINTNQPIVRVIEPQIYIRPQAGGLLVGGYGYRPTSFDMNQLPSDFEIGYLPPDQIYYKLLAEAASRYFPILRGAIRVQERRGLPTMTPDAGPIISNIEEVPGLVIASGCQVAGVAYSPAIGKITAELISGQSSPLATGAEFAVNRFDERFAHDAQLRARCEQVYATMYWGSTAYRHELPENGDLGVCVVVVWPLYSSPKSVVNDTLRNT